MIQLAIARVVDVKVHDQSLLNPEWVFPGSCHVWNQLHVTLVNRGEAANRRCIEQLSVCEELFVNLRHWKVEVLLHSRKICESNINKLDVIVLDVLKYF